VKICMQKVGFTPRLFRDGPPNWQLLSSTVMHSYIPVLGSKTASKGAHALGACQRHPILGLSAPPLTACQNTASKRQSSNYVKFGGGLRFRRVDASLYGENQESIRSDLVSGM